MNIPDELLIEGIARGVAGWLREPETADRVARHLADAQLSEVLTTAEAAEMLRVTTKTLLANHVEWELDKSVAMGADNPRFYRSQILARLRAKEVKGSKPTKVTEFPKNNPLSRAS